VVYRPTARVLTVLELLQAHGRMTGTELARRLEVDIRTIRNYVQTLADMGIPVEAQRGRYGAYALRAGYRLPPLIFTDDEALTLTLSLLLARQSGLAQTSPALEGVLAKVERVLPAATRAQVQAVTQAVAFESERPTALPSTATVTLLSSAIKVGRRVRLRYRSARDEVTERAFDPYGIALHGGGWYVIGYCHLRQGERLFRLDRIAHVECTEETFPSRVDFPALEAVQRALASVPRAWRVEVWLDSSLEQAERQLRMPGAIFAEVDGGVLFRIDVEDLPWMAHLLAGVGIPFVIQRPPELREAVRDYARALGSYAERVATQHAGT
jgi:predicted DNA-binding transcriptional regulator YafY